MAGTTAFDWQAFEQTLFDAWWQDAQGFLAAHPAERIYAFALGGLYREEDGPICLPCLAANSEAAYAEDFGGDADGNPDSLDHVRFHPADWRWPELGSDATSARLRQAEQALNAEATSGTVAHWRATEARLLGVLVRVCRSLAQALRSSRWQDRLTEDFICWLSTPDDGEEADLARQCLGDEVFARIFSGNAQQDEERRRIAALPLDDRIRYHIACLQGTPDASLGLDRVHAQSQREAAQAALWHIGGLRVAHALLPLLDKPMQQWQAAFMLARLGVADGQVIAALRMHVLQPAGKREHESGRDWCAAALGALGDSDWLLQQLDADRAALPVQRIAHGIAHPYRAWNSREDTAPIALDYAPLEAALAHRTQAASMLQALASELAPGSGYCTLRAGDVAEAVRGLQSPHALVRMHAAAIMGERALGDAAAQQLLPALAHAIAHEAELSVRRLAMYSLRDWRHECAPWRASIAQAAERDASEEIRGIARELLRQLPENRMTAP